MRVLVRENTGLPLVAVDCWLAVGALEEADEHAGISHFLEHMFFKGTERFPVGEMDRRVKEIGGYNNAATSMEYTHYFIVAPAEHFETALDLLADHLTDPALPEAEMDRERQVVKEEIRRKDDSPEGRLFTALQRAAFGQTSYAREVLGTPESLDRITPDVMREYWGGRYTADRLVVTVSGDVRAEEVAEAVARRMEGVSPQGVERAPRSLPDGSPGAIDESMDVGQGYLAWGFRTAGRENLSEVCALEVATTMLGGGMTSRLYRRLIEDLRLVTAVSAWDFSLDRIGLLGITSVFAPDRRAEVEHEISSVLKQAAEGVTPDEVARAKAMLAAEFAFGNETNAALSGTMGEFEVVHGGAEKYFEILAGIEAVTAETVSEALARRADLSTAARAWVGPDGS